MNTEEKDKELTFKEAFPETLIGLSEFIHGSSTLELDEMDLMGNMIESLGDEVSLTEFRGLLKKLLWNTKSLISEHRNFHMYEKELD